MNGLPEACVPGVSGDGGWPQPASQKVQTAIPANWKSLWRFCEGVMRRVSQRAADAERRIHIPKGDDSVPPNLKATPLTPQPARPKPKRSFHYLTRRCANTATTMIKPVSIKRLASGTALMLRIFSR